MAAVVSIEIVGLEALIKKLRAYGKRVEEKGKQIIAKHSLDLDRYAKENCAVDMGRLRASISPKFTEGGFIGEVSTNVSYAAFMEFGTGIEGRSGHTANGLPIGPLPLGYQYGNGGKMPPYELIADWVKRKGIQPKDPKMTQEQLIFLIRRKIGDYGLKARPYMYPAYLQVLPEFEADAKRLEAYAKRGAA